MVILCSGDAISGGAIAAELTWLIISDIDLQKLLVVGITDTEYACKCYIV